MTGKSLLLYRIVSKNGAGGRGGVYRAAVSTLSHHVTMTILPQVFTSPSQPASLWGELEYGVEHDGS